MFKFAFTNPSATDADAGTEREEEEEQKEEEEEGENVARELKIASLSKGDGSTDNGEKEEEEGHVVELFIDEGTGKAVTLRKSNAEVPCHLVRSGCEDIVSRRYEGGYKLWECSIDLCRYLYMTFIPSLSLSLSLSRKLDILELGCGHGLPSILLARTMDVKVGMLALHDYNADVLRDVTCRNVLLNLTVGNDKDVEEVRTYSGDWTSLPEAMGGRKFDVVVAAETIYSPRHVRSFTQCLLDTMKDGGVGLVAAKTYYFGVGGGVHAFVQEVERKNKKAVVDRVEVMRDGVSNVREIVRVRL